MLKLISQSGSLVPWAFEMSPFPCTGVPSSDLYRRCLAKEHEAWVELFNLTSTIRVVLASTALGRAQYDPDVLTLASDVFESLRADDARLLANYGAESDKFYLFLRHTTIRHADRLLRFWARPNSRQIEFPARQEANFERQEETLKTDLADAFPVDLTTVELVILDARLENPLPQGSVIPLSPADRLHKCRVDNKVSSFFGSFPK